MHLFLIRHGETDWNNERRIQGHSDTPLNARGIEQAEKLAARLVAEERFDALYTSPLARARATAEIIAKKFDLEPIPDDRLKEKYFGQLEGMSFSEVEQRYPDIAREWQKSQGEFLLPGEESPYELQTRVKSFLDEVTPIHNDSRIAIISHGGTINMFLTTLIEHDIHRRWAFWLDNASISFVDLAGSHARIRLLNDTCHLRNGHG